MENVYLEIASVRKLAVVYGFRSHTFVYKMKSEQPHFHDG